MEQLCETTRTKVGSHIDICLLPRYKDGRQLHDEKILYINRRLKAMSHEKGFNFLDVYWVFNRKPHLFKDGLLGYCGSAGIPGTSVSITTQVDFWTKSSQPSSGNGCGALPHVTSLPFPAVKPSRHLLLKFSPLL